MSNIVNKNNKKINKMSLFYVITLIVIFVAILTTSIILIAKPFDYKEIKDLKETTATSFLKEKPKNSSNSYYVLIYQEDSYKSNIIKKWNFVLLLQRLAGELCKHGERWLEGTLPEARTGEPGGHPRHSDRGGCSSEEPGSTQLV